MGGRGGRRKERRKRGEDSGGGKEGKGRKGGEEGGEREEKERRVVGWIVRCRRKRCANDWVCPSLVVIVRWSVRIRAIRRAHVKGLMFFVMIYKSLSLVT